MSQEQGQGLFDTVVDEIFEAATREQVGIAFLEVCSRFASVANPDAAPDAHIATTFKFAAKVLECVATEPELKDMQGYLAKLQRAGRTVQ